MHKSKLAKALLSVFLFSLGQSTYAAPIEITSWGGLDSEIDQGQTEFILGNDISYESRIDCSGSLEIDANNYSINGQGASNLGINVSKNFTLQNSGAVIIDNDWNIESVDGGVFGFENGALNIQGSAMQEHIDVLIDNVVFHNNSSSGGAGAAFQYTEHTQQLHNIPSNSVTLSNSIFYKNTATYGGSVMIDRSVSTLIENSVFHSNSASASGGALVVARSQNLTIRDTSFINNSSNSYGGAVYVGWMTPAPIGMTLRPVVEYDTSMDHSGSLYKEPLNITIEAVNKDVEFIGNKSNSGGSDIYIQHGKNSDSYIWMNDVQLNLGANSNRKIIFEGDICAEGYSDPNSEPPFFHFDIQINPKDDQLGEVIFLGNVTSNTLKTLNFYRGIVSVGSAASLDGMPIKFMDHNASVLKLNLSQNNSTQTEVYKFGGVSFQENTKYLLDLALDVDLDKGSVDSIEWGGIDPNGSIEARVVSWNVLTDLEAGVQQTKVTVNNGETDSQLTYALGETAQTALGKLYKYDVTLLDNENGTYQFSYAGAISSDPEPDPEPKPEPEPEPTPNPDYSPKPSDFNPEVYAGSITQKMTQVLQHEISHRLFDTNLPTGTLNVTANNSSLNGSVHGGHLSLDVDDYSSSSLNLDYGVTLFSYFTDPIVHQNLESRYGVYGGFVVAKTEDRINDIDSRGAFIGLTTKQKYGPAYLDLHTNLGYLDSNLGSKLGGSEDLGDTWLGAGLSLGYEINLPKTELTVIPSIDTVYTYVRGKKFSTAHSVKIKNSSFNGWEFSPGIRIQKDMGSNENWKVYSEARYVWTNESASAKAISLTGNNNQTMMDQKLPELEFGDYAEFNLGFKGSFDDWHITTGADLQIGDIDGWGVGIEARYNF